VLIAANANVNLCNDYDKTSLHFAAANGHAPVCRLLIKEGASLTKKEYHGGKTPLDYAKERGKAECVTVLKKAAAAFERKVSQ